MHNAGNAPTPTALKMLRGNPGKRRVNRDEPRPGPSRGDCPAWLDDPARALWGAYAPTLIRLGLLTELSEPAFAALCESWSLYRAAAQQVREDGSTVVQPTNGEAVSPHVTIRGKALGDLRALMAEFGMTPAAATRIRVQQEDSSDPLDAFRRTPRRTSAASTAGA